MTGRGNAALLCLVVAVGAVLRFFRLDSQSLWNDELSSWVRTSFTSIADVIKNGTVPDVHPPGYYVLLHLVQRVFGDSEWVLRAPSAIFGTLAVIAVFSLGRRLYGYREGLFAAGLTATLWAPIWISQTARQYSLLVLLATVTMRASYELMMAIREDRRLSPGWFTALVAASVACSYTHYFGLLLVALQAVACAAVGVAHKRRLIPVITVYAAVGLLYTPWIPGFLTQLGRGSSWVGPFDPHVLRELPAYLWNRSDLMAGLAALIVISALAKHLITRRGSNDRSGGDLGFADLTVTWWLLAPIAASVLVSWTVTPVFLKKNLLICLPPCVILVSRCLWMLRTPRWLPATLGTVLIIGSLTQLIAVERYYSTPSTTQFREAARYVVLRSAAVGNPPVAACVWEGRYLDYYFQRFGSGLRVQWVGCEQDVLAARLAPDQPGSPDRLWFVSAHRKPEPDVGPWFYEHYLLLESQRFLGADVMLLERRSEPTSR